jgi:hypothetical protein
MLKDMPKVSCVIPAFGRWKKESYKFEASLSYRARFLSQENRDLHKIIQQSQNSDTVTLNCKHKSLPVFTSCLYFLSVYNFGQNSLLEPVSSSLNRVTQTRCRWLMPVILTTQEAEVRGIMV